MHIFKKPFLPCVNLQIYIVNVSFTSKNLLTIYVQYWTELCTIYYYCFYVSAWIKCSLKHIHDFYCNGYSQQAAYLMIPTWWSIFLTLQRWRKGPTALYPGLTWRSRTFGRHLQRFEYLHQSQSRTETSGKTCVISIFHISFALTIFKLSPFVTSNLIDDWLIYLQTWWIFSSGFFSILCFTSVVTCASEQPFHRQFHTY